MGLYRIRHWRDFRRGGISEGDEITTVLCMYELVKL